MLLQSEPNRSLDGSVPKRFLQGTHRLTSPQETLARINPFLPAMGVTRVANVTGLDRIGVPVIMVCRPNSKSLAVFQGKGLTLEAAKASGLMEAIEAYHAEHISHPIRVATFEDLSRSHSVADVSRLPQPEEGGFRPDLPIHWIEGFDLVCREAAWIPYEMVHLDYTEPALNGSGCFVASSNGLASGNHHLEAISHGICEVVERDALTLWMLLDPQIQSATRINPATIEDPLCQSVIEKFERAGVEFAVWETTTEVDIASFFCTVIERHDDPVRQLYSASGSGCHPCREIALLRALTEAAQSRLAAISGSRDDLTRSLYAQQRDAQFLDQQRFLVQQAAQRSFGSAPTCETSTFDQDVAYQLERLRSAGIDQVVTVDLTQSPFGIPVVRVVIPGMEFKSRTHGNLALHKRLENFAGRYR